MMRLHQPCDRRRALRPRPLRRSRRLPGQPGRPQDTLERIEGFYAQGPRQAASCRCPAGGDHLITLPILRGIAKDRAGRHDPFRRPHRLLRPLFRRLQATPTARRSAAPSRRACSIPSAWSRSASAARSTTARTSTGRATHGMRIIIIEELMDRGADAVIAEARRVVGDGPTYVSFDVDGLDPAYAPGTGTPEIGGFTTARGAAHAARAARARPDRRRRRRGLARPSTLSGMTALGRRQHDVRAPLRAGR